MKSYQFFIATVFLICGFIFCRPVAAQNRLADYTFGGSGQEICSGIIPASDGGFIVGGSTISGISGEVTIAQRATGAAPSMDYWIFKMDVQGNKLWEKRYGGSGDDRLIKVLPSPDGGYLLCGWTTSPTGFDVTAPTLTTTGQNYWVVKTDVQGNKLWDKRYGSLTGEMLMEAIATTDGGYLLTGLAGGPPSGDRSQAAKGQADIWTIKIDALGNKQWDSTLGGLDGDIVYSAANIPGGGFALLALSFGPVSGDVTGPSNGDTDLWLIKLDAAGNKIWDRLYGGSGHDGPNALLATTDGGLLVAGTSYSPISGDVSQAGGGAWLLKVDALGTKQWDRVFVDTTTWIGITNMKALPDGGYALGGQAQDTISTNRARASEYGIMKISSTGVPVWKQLLGGSGDELFNNLIVLPNGDLLIAGTSNSDISRTKTSNSRGVADMWVVKMNSSTALGVTSQLKNVSVSLYPNPVDTPLASLRIDGLREQATVQVELRNVLGQLVYTTQVTVQHGRIQKELNLGNLPPGLYTLRLHTVEGVITRQLMRK
jgi:hypothetical protein